MEHNGLCCLTVTMVIFYKLNNVLLVAWGNVAWMVRVRVALPLGNMAPSLLRRRKPSNCYHKVGSESQ